MTISKTIRAAALGTAAAAAMVVGAAPAQAQGIEEIIAGAVIIGGLAAILGGNRDRYDDRYDDRTQGYGNYGYNSAGDPRQAVEQCVYAARQQASRYGNARVTEIRDVDRNNRGYTVRGRLQVNEGNRGGYGRYDRYGRNDRYGYNRSNYDNGSFSCRVEYGRVVDIDLDNIS